MPEVKPETYSKCTVCGHIEDGVCGLFYGHRCTVCDAVDAAKLLRRRSKAR